MRLEYSYGQVKLSRSHYSGGTPTHSLEKSSYSKRMVEHGHKYVVVKSEMSLIPKSLYRGLYIRKVSAGHGAENTRR